MDGKNLWGNKMSDKIKKSYSEVKSLSVSKKLNIQYKENSRAYYVFITDEIGTIYQSIIYKSDFLSGNVVVGIDLEQNAIDEDDFVINYKTIADTHLSYEKPKTNDNRDYVYTTARPVNTHTIFVSEGDDLSDYRNIGGGSSIELVHNIGESTTHNLYIDFNVIDNPTYIHEGYISFEGCTRDRLSFHFVPRLTSFVASQNTNFNLYGGYLIVPTAGNGNIQITETPNLVCVGTDSNGNNNPGFWDADFNYQTGVFDNLRPNIYGQGAYNIFGSEIIAYRMLQRLILKDSTTKGGEKHLTTDEQGQILHGYRMKCIFEVTGTDHDCFISAILSVFRKHATQRTR
jgi:hypothetical protein